MWVATQEAEPAAQTALNNFHGSAFATIDPALRRSLSAKRSVPPCKRSLEMVPTSNLESQVTRVSMSNPGCAPAMATCKPVEHRSTASSTFTIPIYRTVHLLPPSLYIPKAIISRECGSHNTILLLFLLLLICCCCSTSTSTICNVLPTHQRKSRTQRQPSPPLSLPTSIHPTPPYKLATIAGPCASLFPFLWEWPPIIWVGKITDRVATLLYLARRGDLRLRCSGSAGKNSMQ